MCITTHTQKNMLFPCFGKQEREKAKQLHLPCKFKGLRVGLTKQGLSLGSLSLKGFSLFVIFILLGWGVASHCPHTLITRHKTKNKKTHTPHTCVTHTKNKKQTYIHDTRAVGLVFAEYICVHIIMNLMNRGWWGNVLMGDLCKHPHNQLELI